MFRRRGIVLFLCLGGFCLSAIAELIDPTQPSLPSGSLFAEGNEGGMQLNAIFYTSGNPVAVIDGKLLHLNDAIGNYKVTRIQKQDVQLTSQKGEVVDLKIETLEVKKPHME